MFSKFSKKKIIKKKELDNPIVDNRFVSNEKNYFKNLGYKL